MSHISKLLRLARIASQGKQERMQVKNGKPSVKELRPDVPVLRATSEGIVEYVKHNGVLYKKVLDKG